MEEPANREEPRKSSSTPPSFFAVALEPGVVRRGLSYALVVGSVLIAINHGDVLLAGHLSPSLLLKMGLTICVPYCVSTASSVGAIRSQHASVAS